MCCSLSFLLLCEACAIFSPEHPVLSRSCTLSEVHFARTFRESVFLLSKFAERKGWGVFGIIVFLWVRSLCIFGIFLWLFISPRRVLTGLLRTVRFVNWVSPEGVSVPRWRTFFFCAFICPARRMVDQTILLTCSPFVRLCVTSGRLHVTVASAQTRSMPWN